MAAVLVAGLASLAPVGALGAQAAPAAGVAASRTADSLAAIALADSALAAISRREFGRLADLMLPEARTFSSRERDGQWRYASRTREEQRASSSAVPIAERGFGPTALVSGPLAVVWMPYDLYLDGNWSHCGVDALTLLKVDGSWRIATFAWSVEQPPACRKHPDGPPR
jgi:hypothetical protein